MFIFCYDANLLFSWSLPLFLVSKWVLTKNCCHRVCQLPKVMFEIQSDKTLIFQVSVFSIIRLDKVKCSGWPLTFWGYIVHYIVHLKTNIVHKYSIYSTLYSTYFTHFSIQALRFTLIQLLIAGYCTISSQLRTIHFLFNPISVGLISTTFCEGG